MGPGWNTSPFLRLYASPIWKNSFVFKAPREDNLQVKHLQRVDESNLEKLLVIKAPREDDPRVEQLPRMDQSNPEQLLVFKAPRVGPRV